MALNLRRLRPQQRQGTATIVLIDLKRITRCKLASIFTSADHRKFLGLFGPMFGSDKVAGVKVYPR